MPKATIEEQETAPEPEPVPEVEIPEEPVEEVVPVPKKVRFKAAPTAAPPKAPAKAAPAKASVRKDAPRKTNLKDRHTCGGCGQEMSLHTALYGHTNCPGKASLPQPPALVRQVAAEPEEVPQLSQAQTLRVQLAQAAQERRAQAHMRMVAPIRSFYGL